MADTKKFPPPPTRGQVLKRFMDSMVAKARAQYGEIRKEPFMEEWGDYFEMRNVNNRIVNLTFLWTDMSGEPHTMTQDITFGPARLSK